MMENDDDDDFSHFMRFSLICGKRENVEFFQREHAHLPTGKSQHLQDSLCIVDDVDQPKTRRSLSLASMKIDNMEFSSSLCEKYSAKTREKRRERVENS